MEEKRLPKQVVELACKKKVEKADQTLCGMRGERRLTEEDWRNRQNR